MKHLKEKNDYQYSNPDRKVLDTFPNPGVDEVTLECTEVTSLCAQTGQPDYDFIRIQYAPDKVCLESKSLKLYLGAFRQERIFGEHLVKRIFDDLLQVLSPRHLSVQLRATPRGGISVGATKNGPTWYTDNNGIAVPAPVPPLWEEEETTRRQ